MSVRSLDILDKLQAIDAGLKTLDALTEFPCDVLYYDLSQPFLHAAHRVLDHLDLHVSEAVRPYLEEIATSELADAIADSTAEAIEELHKGSVADVEEAEIMSILLDLKQWLSDEYDRAREEERQDDYRRRRGILGNQGE